jgi:hypothetical protein
METKIEAFEISNSNVSIFKKYHGINNVVFYKCANFKTIMCCALGSEKMIN